MRRKEINIHKKVPSPLALLMIHDIYTITFYFCTLFCAINWNNQRLIIMIKLSNMWQWMKFEMGVCRHEVDEHRGSRHCIRVFVCTSHLFGIKENYYYNNVILRIQAKGLMRVNINIYLQFWIKHVMICRL